MTDTTGTRDVVAGLRARFTAWNNPPSEGLPEGAGVLLVAADLIERLSRELLEAKEALKSNSREIDEIADRIVATNKIRADQLRMIASRMQFSARSVLSPKKDSETEGHG